MTSLRFSAPLWKWPGDAAWFFVTLPEDMVGEVRFHALTAGLVRPGGMVRVTARTGALAWQTSLFAQKSGGYLLPIKAEIRRRAGLGIGDEVALRLDLA